MPAKLATIAIQLATYGTAAAASLTVTCDALCMAPALPLPIIWQKEAVRGGVIVAPLSKRI